MNFLLENHANVNAINEDGDTPLHLAIQNHNLCTKTIKVLLDFGADFKKKNKNGESPLDKSKLLPESDALNIIIDHMSKIQMEKSKTKVTKALNFTLEECVLCVNPREEIYSLLPCGHAKTCEICCLKLIAMSNVNSVCPICRSKITGYRKIYV